MPAKKRSIQAHRKRSRSDSSDSGGNSLNIRSNDARSQDISKRKSKNKRVSPNARKQLIYGSSVLVVAIVAGFLWNLLDNSTDPRIVQFWSQICRVAQCARYITPIRRTLQAARPVRPGEIVAEIPRSLQIWDLDALRDEFVQTQLLPARHPRTENRLSSGAFLAAYVALQFFKVQPNEVKNPTASVSELDPTRKAYYEALPTLEELSDHPLFGSQQELVEMLGPKSHSLAVVSAYHEIVNSEYQALAEASPTFADAISEINYTMARVWVLTRTFSPGPTAVQQEFLDDDERDRIASHVSTDLSKGCHAMVPILDLLNHHPNPNVAYSYNLDKRAFVITAERKIPSGFEIYDSYGKFTDAHLFAKFGFNNGDGSGHTEASIALFHRVLDYRRETEFSYFSDHNTEQNRMVQNAQRKGLLRYLQYDDGYKECISGPDAADPKAWELKELKFLHLKQIANDASRWVTTVPPRRPNSRPVESSEVSIVDGSPEIDLGSVRLNIMPLVETCRLISLVHSDYDDEIIDILRDNLGAENFVLQPGNDALEYRAFMW